MEKPLSNHDIMRALDYQTNIITYENLMNVKNIDEILKNNTCVIFYEGKDIGHWVCVFKTKNGYEYFDSYGNIPDHNLKKKDNYFRKKIPHLTWLLYRTGKPIEYNNYKLQEYNKNINTCGRWVIARLLLKKMPLKKFVKLFRTGNIPSDILVTLFA